MNQKTLTVVDLCCGCGMAALGFRKAGLEVEWGVDLWEEAAFAFSRNLERDGFLAARSVAEFALEALDWGGPRPDVVITGPPCQDDSRLGKWRDRDQGRGAVKVPSLLAAVALRPTWILMEMVSREWVGWALENGARQVLRLRDWDLGGTTLRIRWVAVWGPEDLELEERPGTPWEEVLGVEDSGAVIATEANGLGKRWRLAKGRGEPVNAVVGHGAAHRIRFSDGTERRLTPAEEAALSGHPGLDLTEFPTVRDAQTAVGNGWPCSYGRALGEAILRASAGRDLPPVDLWEELDVEELHALAVEDRRARRPAVDPSLPASTFTF